MECLCHPAQTGEEKVSHLVVAHNEGELARRPRGDFPARGLQEDGEQAGGLVASLAAGGAPFVFLVKERKRKRRERWM